MEFANTLEEQKKKLSKDMESLHRRIEELEILNDKLEKSKKKFESEVGS